MLDKATALADIDSVLTHQPSTSGSVGVAEVVALYESCVARWTPPGSQYRAMLARAIEVKSLPSPGVSKIEAQFRGLLQALRADIAADRLRSFEELVHASLFDDLLGQAEYLLRETFRLAATVIAGAVLEEHLRKLCTRNGIPTVKPNADPIKAASMNDELKKAALYGKPQHSLILAWLHLRNEAAHNDPVFQSRTQADIDPMIAGIRAFLSSHPA